MGALGVGKAGGGGLLPHLLAAPLERAAEIATERSPRRPTRRRSMKIRVKSWTAAATPMARARPACFSERMVARATAKKTTRFAALAFTGERVSPRAWNMGTTVRTEATAQLKPAR